MPDHQQNLGVFDSLVFGWPTVHPHIVITDAPQPEAKSVRTWLERARHPSAAINAVRLLADLLPEASLGTENCADSVDPSLPAPALETQLSPS